MTEYTSKAQNFTIDVEDASSNSTTNDPMTDISNNIDLSNGKIHDKYEVFDEDGIKDEDGDGDNNEKFLDTNGNLSDEYVTEFPEIETILFYAQREIEDQYERTSNDSRFFKKFYKLIYNSLKIDKLSLDNVVNDSPNPNSIYDYPKRTKAELIMKTTTWYAATGLITTEIMGAAFIPWGMGVVGYVPSNIMLVVYCILAVIAGFLIWWAFVILDSPQYPVRTFADIGGIVFGDWCKYTIISMQLLFLIFTAAIITTACAQALEIMRDERVCYVGLTLLLSGVLYIFGQLREVNYIAKICMFAAVVNYIGMFVQMKYLFEYLPNYANAETLLAIDKGPIIVTAVASGNIIGKFAAMTSLAYVFCGSIVFPEIISELKRPWDFWKCAFLAQAFILIVYLIYGNVIYSKQGQFSITPAVFGISVPSALKGLSFLTFICGFAQALFYGNISSKIAYNNFVIELLNGPEIREGKGWLYWIGVTFIVWLIVFIIGAGIPQVSTVGTLISALVGIPITFGIPFIFHLAILYHKSNIENSDYYNVRIFRCINKSNIKKLIFKNGFEKFKTLSVVYAILAFCTIIFCFIGILGAIGSMVFIFENTPSASFSCTSPI
ncbi:hypothetical protein BVG19_g871 [[Candida] boidinii]|nr:hypothetical protein BVG19_g871 [[Candida] boidinii]OWB48732.1 hypothetical protein B5S27_g267 [[Candida] boidinii]